MSSTDGEVAHLRSEVAVMRHELDHLYRQSETYVAAIRDQYRTIRTLKQQLLDKDQTLCYRFSCFPLASPPLLPPALPGTAPTPP